MSVFMIDGLLQCTFATLKGKYTQNVTFEEVFQMEGSQN